MASYLKTSTVSDQKGQLCLHGLIYNKNGLQILTTRKKLEFSYGILVQHLIVWMLSYCAKNSTHLSERQTVH